MRFWAELLTPSPCLGSDVQLPSSHQGSPQISGGCSQLPLPALTKQGGEGALPVSRFCSTMQAHVQCSSVCGLCAIRVVGKDVVCGQRERSGKGFLR